MTKLYMLLLFLILCGTPHAATTTAGDGLGSGSFSRMFSFGDSATDTGNGATVNPNSSSNMLPYGETFFGHPTGHFSDGRITVDFLVMGHRKRSKVDISSESNSDNDCSLSSDNHDSDVHLSNHDESSDNHDQHFEENDPLLHLTKEELMKKLKIKLGKRPFTDDHKKKRHKVESDSIIDDALLEIHNDLVLHYLKMKLSMLGEQSKNKRKTFEKDNQQGQEAVNIDGVHCKFSSFGSSFKQGGELSNFVMSVFCRYMFKSIHPSKSKRHYFFSSIGNDLMKHPSKTNFGMVQKSFSGASLARPIEICDMMRVLFSLTPYLKKKKTINTMLDADCLDCGIFTLKFMEIWRPKVLLTNQFSQKDIPNIRIQYVNKLFFHPCNIVLNSATKKLVTDYYAKG
ncbi:hypothetical protein OsI_11689 [Oryza sativa Indica Group]|uniref:Uncharacterized protein n=1 Tax=Oryza sativa subsp. indica TaxID=39946 RepID=B8AQ59_ORYSI|nr:hypothetical protein OsI_11689 [Oryza sativa Indica Group]